MEQIPLDAMRATVTILSFGLLSAMAAVGAVVTIKVARRRRALVDTGGTALDRELPPSRPLSAAAQRRWMQRYVIVFVALLAMLLLLATRLLP